MNLNPNFSPATVNIHIPLRLKRRGGRKLIVTPEGHTLAPTPAQKREPDAPLVKALLKAWKWQKDLESGKAQSMENHARTHHKQSIPPHLQRLYRKNQRILRQNLPRKRQTLDRPTLG